MCGMATYDSLKHSVNQILSLRNLEDLLGCFNFKDYTF